MRLILDRMASEGPALSAEALVDGCLELMGSLKLESDTHEALVQHANRGGDLHSRTPEDRESFNERATEMLQLIVATPEYQFA